MSVKGTTSSPTKTSTNANDGDLDNDGIKDALEKSPSPATTPPTTPKANDQTVLPPNGNVAGGTSATKDSDGDGIVDSKDKDKDGDGVNNDQDKVDNASAVPDAPKLGADGKPLPVDANKDGLPDAPKVGADGKPLPVDANKDGLPDAPNVGADGTPVAPAGVNELAPDPNAPPASQRKWYNPMSWGRSSTPPVTNPDGTPSADGSPATGLNPDGTPAAAPQRSLWDRMTGRNKPVDPNAPLQDGGGGGLGGAIGGMGAAAGGIGAGMAAGAVPPMADPNAQQQGMPPQGSPFQPPMSQGYSPPPTVAYGPGGGIMGMAQPEPFQPPMNYNPVMPQQGGGMGQDMPFQPPMSFNPVQPPQGGYVQPPMIQGVSLQPPMNYNPMMPPQGGGYVPQGMPSPMPPQGMGGYGQQGMPQGQVMGYPALNPYVQSPQGMGMPSPMPPQGMMPPQGGGYGGQPPMMPNQQTDYAQQQGVDPNVPPKQSTLSKIGNMFGIGGGNKTDSTGQTTSAPQSNGPGVGQIAATAAALNVSGQGQTNLNPTPPLDMASLGLGAGGISGVNNTQNGTSGGGMMDTLGNLMPSPAKMALGMGGVGLLAGGMLM